MMEILALYLNCTLFFSSLGVKDAVIYGMYPQKRVGFDNQIYSLMELVSVWLIAICSYWLGTVSTGFPIFAYLACSMTYPFVHNGFYCFTMSQVETGYSRGFLSEPKQSDTLILYVWQRVLLLAFSFSLLVITIINQ